MKRYFKVKKLLLVIILFIGIFVFFNNNTIYAKTAMEATDSGCRAEGNCQLNDLMKVVIFYSDKFLGLVGSLALLFFVYGGVLFLISAGNSEMVEKAKKTLMGAVIGIVIVFTSFMIIGFILNALGVIDNVSDTSWAKVGWFADKGTGKN